MHLNLVSQLYHSTLVTLLGLQAHNGVWLPDSIALSFTNTFRPLHHIKMSIQEGADMHRSERNVQCCTTQQLAHEM